MFIKNSILVLVIALLATSCANYKAQSLSNITVDSTAFYEKKEGITVSCKAFTPQDCKRYLDRDVIAKGIQPIQISIDNDSKHILMFSKSNISIPCADTDYVANKVHTSTVGRSTAYGVGAIIFWPLAIPAIVDGVKSSDANDQLDNDFAGKASRDQIIQPYGTLNGLIFVPVESYQESFTLTLVDRETKEPIVFALNAPR
jgi:hypothetical protein